MKIDCQKITAFLRKYRLLSLEVDLSIEKKEYLDTLAQIAKSRREIREILAYFNFGLEKEYSFDPEGFKNELQREFWPVQVSPDGQTLVIAKGDYELRIIDLENYDNSPAILAMSEKDIEFDGFFYASNDGVYVRCKRNYLPLNNQQTDIFFVSKKERLRFANDSMQSAPQIFAGTPDGGRYVGFWGHNVVALLDGKLVPSATGFQSGNITIPEMVRVDIAADGKSAFSKGVDDRLYFWDCQEEQLARVLTGEWRDYQLNADYNLLVGLNDDRIAIYHPWLFDRDTIPYTLGKDYTKLALDKSGSKIYAVNEKGLIDIYSPIFGKSKLISSVDLGSMFEDDETVKSFAVSAREQYIVGLNSGRVLVIKQKKFAGK